VNITWCLRDFDTDQLARFFRCVVDEDLCRLCAKGLVVVVLPATRNDVEVDLKRFLCRQYVGRSGDFPRCDV
jgi:hypothetical protein